MSVALDWLHTCRLCLYKCSNDETVSNIIQIFRWPVIVGKIAYVTDLKVFESDGLPGVICQRCNQRLSSAETFKRLAQESNKSLNHLLHHRSLSPVKLTSLEEVPVQLQSEACDGEPLALIEEEKAFSKPGSVQLYNLSDDIEESFSHSEDTETPLSPSLDIEDPLTHSIEEPLFCSESVECHFMTFDESAGNAEICIVKQEEIVEEIIVYSEDMIPYDSLKIEIEELDYSLANKTEYNCEICGKVLASAANLSQHRRYVHINQRPLKCNVCGRGFNTRHHLKRHSLRHTRVKPVKPDKPTSVSCSTCSKVFPSSKHLSDHRRNVHTIKLHQCAKCQLEFSSRSKLKRHRVVHSTLSGPHTCGICGQGFNIPIALWAHLKSHEPKEIKMHGCEQCGREFSKLWQLVQHEKSHSDHRPFHCSICEAKFKNKQGLLEHATIHSDVKQFLCSICGKSFRKKRSLLPHHRMHTGERPYACTVCGKRFKTHSSRAVHLRRHEGVRPFVCEVCGGTFVTKATLTRHGRTHTGERPHVCKVCGRAFGRSEHLVTHMVMHTGERMYHCADCQRSFAYKVALVKHYKNSCVNQRRSSIRFSFAKTRS